MPTPEQLERDLGVWDGISPQVRAERQAEIARLHDAFLVGHGPDWSRNSKPPDPPTDPPPTYEERVRRATEMGLVLCACSSVQRDGKAVMIYNPACEVHRSRRSAA